MIEIVADRKCCRRLAHRSRPCRRHQRVRHDEFMLGVANDEYRAAGQADDALGDAAHHQVRHPAAAMRAHDDQVDAGLLRVVHDRQGRRVRGEDDLAEPAAGPDRCRSGVRRAACAPSPRPPVAASAAWPCTPRPRTSATRRRRRRAGRRWTRRSCGRAPARSSARHPPPRRNPWNQNLLERNHELTLQHQSEHDLCHERIAELRMHGGWMPSAGADSRRSAVG